MDLAPSRLRVATGGRDFPRHELGTTSKVRAAAALAVGLPVWPWPDKGAIGAGQASRFGGGRSGGQAARTVHSYDELTSTQASRSPPATPPLRARARRWFGLTPAPPALRARETPRALFVVWEGGGVVPTARARR